MKTVMNGNIKVYSIAKHAEYCSCQNNVACSISSQNSIDKCMKYDMKRNEENKLDLILCEMNHIRH